VGQGESVEMSVSLSEAAARRINSVAAEQGVRLEVLGGGCSGYQYKLVIDKTSLPFVEGSEVDYGETLMESGFRVVNPQAASSCGCGTSFSIKD